MKNFLKILVLVTIIALITIIIFTIRYQMYNKIDENWILKISPNYLNSPPNNIYLYEDSYVITNCFTVGKWQDKVHKRGKLTSEVNEALIEKLKQEANKELEFGATRLVSVTLKSGEELTLTVAAESINEIIDKINYKGTIWYVQDN